ELESYVKQIRSLVPPTSELVKSAYGNSCTIDLGSGPFSSHEEFHRLLRMGEDPEDWRNEIYKVVRQESHTRRYLSKFSHVDLVLRNVLVHKGRISAIIDRGCAGVQDMVVADIFYIP
ncbi:hypothetical protein DFH07DRAFT_747088, partial [Mycena maculata]